METTVARDQFSESVNAVMELRKSGKTIHAADERIAEPTNAGPNCAGDAGAFEKTLETGVLRRPPTANGCETAQ